MSGSGFAFVSVGLEDRLSAFAPEFWAAGDCVPVNDSPLVGEGTSAGLHALIARIRNMAVRTYFVEKKL